MEIPDIIKQVGFDFDWNEKDVWKLNYPAEKVDISLLEWHFDIPFWGRYELKPNDVVNNKEKYAQEYERTMNSDLMYPIDIMENKGRYLILDGLHRLLKHKLLGHEKVKVRIIPRSEIPNISKNK